VDQRKETLPAQFIVSAFVVHVQQPEFLVRCERQCAVRRTATCVLLYCPAVIRSYGAFGMPLRQQLE
jgi:hypothetical protein